MKDAIFVALLGVLMACFYSAIGPGTSLGWIGWGLFALTVLLVTAGALVIVLAPAAERR